MPKDLYVTELKSNEISLWEKKKPILNKLDMELTERCNNNCIHCYINLPADDMEAKAKELSTEEIKDIIKQAADLGCLKIKFTGGEPLLREDFEEIYLFTRKSGIKVVLFTNGTLIDNRLIELFSRIPPLGMIEITVYGMKKKSYEAISRVPGSYEAAWRGMNLLLEKKIPFMVKGVVLPPNEDEIDEFESWASTLPWMKGSPSFVISLVARARGDSENKNRQIKGLRLSTEEELQIATRSKEEYLKETKEFCSKFSGLRGDKLFNCGAGVGLGCVDAYGFLQACMFLRHPDTVYNLRKGTLKEAFTTFFPKVRELKAKNLEYLERCACCFIKDLCGQCPGKSWMEDGSLDTPIEYLCESAHSQARYIGLLKDGEKSWEVDNWQERIVKIGYY